jgi:predicted AAA+ superfamily ATPase
MEGGCQTFAGRIEGKCSGAVSSSGVFAVHFWRDRAGHEVDFILEEAGKLVALEIKAGSQVTTADLIGIRAFRAALKRKASLVRGVVLHSGKSRPLDPDDIAQPWGWMVPEPR